MKACFSKSFFSHFLVEVSAFWWSNHLELFEEGFLAFPWSTEEKLVVVAGKQMVGVSCFWDLYLVAELCKRLVTFSAAYAPCHKSSAVEFRASAALVFSIFLALLVWNCKVTHPVVFSGYRWSFTSMHDLHAARELSFAARPWISCQAPACCSLQLVSGIDLAGFRVGLVLPKFTFKQVWQVWLLIPVAKSSGTCKIII